MKEKISIYTDGGARGNPGTAGAGAVVCDASGNVLKTGSRALGIMTNNEAEYEAVLLGFSLAKELFGKKELKQKEITVYLDSELVARQLSGIYQIKEERLAVYFMKIWNMRVEYLSHISFMHIPREKNKEADALANRAMDEAASDTLL